MMSTALPISPTVLVVDDEPSICILAQDILSAHDLHVLTAQDGFDALRVLKEVDGRVDLAVLDYSMPGMDCETLISRLREVNAQIKLVISSGASVNLNTQVEASVVDGLIPKPYSMRQLSDLVLSLVGKRASRETNE